MKGLKESYIELEVRGLNLFTRNNGLKIQAGKVIRHKPDDKSELVYYVGVADDGEIVARTKSGAVFTDKIQSFRLSH